MQRQDTPLILLTRPQAASARFAARLVAACPAAAVLISPLQAVQFADWPRPLVLPEAVIFTSQNAVEAAARAGLSGRAFCVGDQTAEAAVKAGFDAVSAGGTADDLVGLIIAARPASVWHLRGADTRGDVAGRLRKAGISVFEAVVYRTEDRPLTGEAITALGQSRPILLPLFSPKSAARASAALTSVQAPLIVLCLSAAVGRAAARLPAVQRRVAKRPDADGMLEIVLGALISGPLT